jgi:hypothetical protein
LRGLKSISIICLTATKVLAAPSQVLAAPSQFNIEQLIQRMHSNSALVKTFNAKILQFVDVLARIDTQGAASTIIKIGTGSKFMGVQNKVATSMLNTISVKVYRFGKPQEFFILDAESCEMKPFGVNRNGGFFKGLGKPSSESFLNLRAAEVGKGTLAKTLAPDSALPYIGNFHADSLISRNKCEALLFSSQDFEGNFQFVRSEKEAVVVGEIKSVIAFTKFVQIKYIGNDTITTVVSGTNHPYLSILKGLNGLTAVVV